MKALEKVKVGDLLCCAGWPPASRCRMVVERTPDEIWVEYESSFFDLDGIQPDGSPFIARVATLEDLRDWGTAAQKSHEAAFAAAALAEAAAAEARYNGARELSQLLQLPWQAIGCYVGTCEDSSQAVCYVSSHRNRTGRKPEEERAVAKFIVTACNSFDDMLAALQNMVGMFDTPVVRMRFNTEYHREACRSAREALAKGKL